MRSTVKEIESRAPTAAVETPVTLVSGDLGSGKTTLINHLLRQPDMAGAAVIVNEFGDVGIDHHLVETVLGEAVLLNSGCLCCALRGDLVDTMGILAWRADRGELPAFDRLVIETSGLADPAPIVQTVMSAPTVADRFRLKTMVTTVDAVNGTRRIAESSDVRKQIALASRLLVTKTDLASSSAGDAIGRVLRDLNPAAEIRRVSHGRVDSDWILESGDYDPLAFTDGLTDAADQTVHEDVRTFCLTRETPLPWRAFSHWLDSITSLRGADLLRIKGIVNVRGKDTPAVVHGVQHLFHAPQFLPSWPDADRRTRIVCITRGITEADLSQALDAATGIPSPEPKQPDKIWNPVIRELR